MLIIFDADILSSFAKAQKIGLLEKIFAKAELVYSPVVQQEIFKAQAVGFSFPQEIFKSKLKTVSLNQKEVEIFQDLSLKERSLHLGELESIAIAKNRKAIFATNDQAALNFCLTSKIDTLSLKDCLKTAAHKLLLGEQEMRQLIQQIEIKDNTFIKNKQEIFDIYKKL